MKVVIVVDGSRGDVQPMVVLARALTAAGHSATIVAPSHLAPYAAEYGVRLKGLRGTGVDGTALQRIGLMTTFGGVRGLRARVQLARRLRPVFGRILEELWGAVVEERPDTVVHLPGAYAGHHMAERLGVPAVVVSFAPMHVPTADMANPLLPGWVPATKISNRSTYALTSALIRPYHGVIDTWREQVLRLPRRADRHDPLITPDGSEALVLNAYSRHVVPVPSDAPPTSVTTGFWLSEPPPTWSPPAGLLEFLERGDPVIYIGFGSMQVRDPERMRSTVMAAIQQARVRAVVATGWGGLSAGEDLENVYAVDQVPHSWLFPRVAAVIHHGGAGTVAAALAAGRPQIICPCFYEQPFWGRRMQLLGVGCSPVLLRRLTPAVLSGNIGRATSDETMAGRARARARLMAAEGGVATAVSAIEEAVASQSSGGGRHSP